MKFNFFYILFIFSAISSYGQVEFKSDVESEEYKVNQKIKVTFILETNGDNLVQETPLRLPDFSKFIIVGSASDQNSYIDPLKRIVINQQVFQYTISPKEPGKIRIGSALVTINGKIYKTEPIDIIVKDADKKAEVADNSKDIYLDVELKKKEVYKNQPVIAVLKVFSKDYDNFRKIQQISLPQQSNINIKPVSFTKSEIESNERNNWSSQVIAVFMIFPNKSGRIEIPSVSASLKSSEKTEKISSNKIKLHVKNLPVNSPNGYKNAVGKFDVSIGNNPHSQAPEINKPIDVFLKIAGEGNLSTLSLPKILPSADYTFYKPNITSSTEMSSKGLSGEVLAHYVIVPKRAGEIVIRTEDFSYFSPEENKYFDLGPKILALKVMTSEQISDAKTTLEKVNEYTNKVLETVNTPVLNTEKLKVKNKSSINWSMVFINFGFMLAIIYAAFVYRRYRILRNQNTPKNTASQPEISITETELQIRKKMKPDYEAHLSYINNLFVQKNYSGFFAAYEDLQNDLENRVREKNYKTVQEFVEKEKGTALSEKFRYFLQKIQMEKYAPVHSEENMEELNESLQHIYSEIVK